MSIREIKEIVKGSNQIDGAGVKLVRVIGYSNVYDFDPFLMLDAFDSRNPSDYTKGFPWHPHRGIETITYLIHGEIEHGDSMGNHGSIKDGGCQWMTAGRAIMHQEMPKTAEWMLGMQIWLNLPKKDKLVPPKYHDIREEDIPIVKEQGSIVKVLSGAYKDQAGATQGDYVKAIILDVELQPGVTWKVDTEPENTAFIYIVEGEGQFGGKDKQYLQSKRAVLFGKGDEIIVTTQDSPLRMVLLMGKPLKEPIAWGGPIVMNTEEELEQAFQEIRNNTFGNES